MTDKPEEILERLKISSATISDGLLALNSTLVFGGHLEAIRNLQSFLKHTQQVISEEIQALQPKSEGENGS